MLTNQVCEIKTQFTCQSVQFSPFSQKVLIGTAQQFGVVGNGCVVIADKMQQNNYITTWGANTQAAVFSVSFSEFNENIFATTGGDGIVRLWNMGNPTPVAAFQNHNGECQACGWNGLNKNIFCSGGYEGRVNLQDVEQGVAIKSQQDHKSVIQDTVFNQRNPNLLLSCSADKTFKLFDVRQPNCIMSITASPINDILSIDFNKYHEMICVSSNADKAVKLWDLRSVGGIQEPTPMQIFQGHEYPVRKIRFSPHFDNLFASVSQDMTVILWDTKRNSDGPIKRYQDNTEFIVGLDWNLFERGQLATASWDRSVKIYNMLG